MIGGVTHCGLPRIQGQKETSQRVKIRWKKNASCLAGIWIYSQHPPAREEAPKTTGPYTATAQTWSKINSLQVYKNLQNSCIDESLGKKDQNILSLKSTFWHDERNVTEMIFQGGDLSYDDFWKLKNWYKTAVVSSFEDWMDLRPRILACKLVLLR